MTGIILLSAAAAGLGAFFAAEKKASKGNLTAVPDYLLILGCRVRGEEAEPTLCMRAEAAAEYLQANPSVIAVACGGIVHKDQTKSEAQAILELLTEKGIEKERIILEDKSRTTVENFLNAGRLIPEADSKRLAFISSEFHLMRASAIAKRCKLKVQCLPAPSPKEQRLKNYLRELVAFPLVLTGEK